LVGKKQAGCELGMGPSIPALNAFADDNLYRWMKNDPEKDGKRSDFRELNDIVLDILNED
jgi:hypothetical protein